MIVREDVEVASSLIGCLVRRTPVAKVVRDSSGRSTEVWFKLEHLQHTGPFKARGALNRVLSAAEQGQIGPAGVVAASGRNTGLAFAYAAGQAGTTSRIFVPANAPGFKVNKVKALGAEVVQVGNRLPCGHVATYQKTRPGSPSSCAGPILHPPISLTTALRTIPSYRAGAFAVQRTKPPGRRLRSATPVEVPSA